MSAPEGQERLHLSLAGVVQGVGFRPFVYRLARSLDLTGFVANSPTGVSVEVQGEGGDVRTFAERVRREGPRASAVTALQPTPMASREEAGFEIRESELRGAATAAILPDLATCPDCLAELEDPRNRRFRYPFTNCTACGPRYSIVLDLPYDRTRTTMRRFAMCPRCRTEYGDPADRRFHAEPNACPACGPQLELWDQAGRLQCARDEALQAAAVELRRGRILAMKGIGGFHLLVDARDDQAVQRLRQRKRREAKPLAVLAPSLEWIRAACRVDEAEEALLASGEAPIVLVRARPGAVAPSVAPGSASLGVLLPYSPLHHLLVRELGFPVVATSGNASDEPMCIDEREAVARLSTVADLFLVHDRPIAHRADDSVARFMGGRAVLLRRGRGYAPLPIAVAAELPPILALGGHQKNAVALGVGRSIVLGPHVGDLDHEAGRADLRDTAAALVGLYRVTPAAVVCDLHPDYATSAEARRSRSRVIEVQHHHAHVLAAMADCGLEPPVLGFAWDGSGYGGDGTVWGGETLLVGEHGFRRLASFLPFPLPGGERAVREPRRSALGALYAALGAGVFENPAFVARHLFGADEAAVLRRMLAANINCPRTSSVGRLFDAVAALAGLHPVAAFEGQAAMALEAALGDEVSDAAYPFGLVTSKDGLRLVDWRPMLRRVLEDRAAGLLPAAISRAFHNTLAEALCALALEAKAARVVLSGGCFQNRYLTERAISGLRRRGIEPFWHHGVPPNDGGLAVGQVLAAAQVLRDTEA